MNLSPAAAAAVEPRGRDFAEVRELVLEQLGKVPSSSMNDLRVAVFAARGLTRESLTEPVPVDAGSSSAVEALDESHPAVLSRRLQFALNAVLHDLYVEGAIAPAAGNLYGASSDSIPARGPSWRGSVPFEHHHTPAPAASRWKLAAHSVVRADLARADLPGGFVGLLGARGSEVLGEGVRAFHRGLFIAAVDLLGAASEAAWFGLGAEISEDSRLVELIVKGTNAAEVIDRTADAIRKRKAWDSRGLNDLRAQAAHLRDLRNYGLHPTGEPDEDREPAFSEAGCAVLYMRAPRYFRQLDQIRERLRVTQSSAGGSGAGST